ncbi:hypothetical protein ALC57_16481 [Trachymyrmex cornetzi]|uniref:HAT C-terminal dimerisation domain-containing protein n=1 Tax=Trachymyrmex cornetzi TaxID=471704 RepID=A0A151IV23_9HYME|nr:hypothetical protein ALC57_16481 [Trachymyrmex cornetzi]
MCDESKKRKRSFQETWLTDDRYKSWIRNIMYYCIVCIKNLSCVPIHVSRHANSACNKNLEKNTLCVNDDTSINSSFIKDTSIKNCNIIPTFKKKWLYFEQFKCWLREAPHENLFYCLICDKYLTTQLSHIYRHAKSQIHIKNTHIKKCQSFNETSESNEDLNIQNNESLLLFEERKKEAEIRFVTLITEKNCKKILSLFKYIAKDPNILQSMTMSCKKCTNIITNVLSPTETERVVNSIQNTKFTIFIDETSDICNDKWMTFLVRFVESETLDTRTQLVKLIDIDEDCSAEKLYEALIPFTNIVALSCDNAAVMTGKHLSLKKNWNKYVLTFSCPCHSKWFALPSDFTLQKKESLAKLNVDGMWKEILQSQHQNNIDKYPNLTKVLNTIRSLPNSNADSERTFSFLNDLKTKKRNKLLPNSVNASCILTSALKARGETCLTVTIEEKHLSRMSGNILLDCGTLYKILN